MKQCSRCKESKPFTAFGINRREKSGLRPECRECRALETKRDSKKIQARVIAWRKANPEKYQASLEKHSLSKRRQEAKWRETHKEHKAATDRRWFEKTYAEKPKKFRDQYLAWQKKYPDRARALNSRGAARRREAMAVGDCTPQQWEAILAYYHHRCAQCGAEGSLTIDHFIPLVRGGHHESQNLWPLCDACNHRKHARMPVQPAPPHAIAFLLEAS
jgi:5-methylcytosine-specific restriction endonuclease McrA